MNINILGSVPVIYLDQANTLPTGLPSRAQGTPSPESLGTVSQNCKDSLFLLSWPLQLLPHRW